MKTLLLLACVSGLAACGESSTTTSLFDGKTLTGWTGDTRLWRAEGGEIVGSTEGVMPLVRNSFLSHETSFGDFALRLQFKLRNHNSGIQFRSEVLPDFVVRGYQADLADVHDATMGILYEEGGRGFIDKMAIPTVYDHVDPTDWNDYEVRAVGAHIVLTINGFVTVDYTEVGPGARAGFFALQIHVGDPMEVRYRDLRVETLD